MPSVHATLIARGGGSGFHRKNVYRLLGKPVVQYAVEACLAADFIDEVFVWTEDKEIRAIAEAAGACPIERPRTMVHYFSGFASSDQWVKSRMDQVVARCGGPADINVAFNCNNFLFRPETLKEMLQRLLDHEEYGGLIAVTPVRPGLCLKNLADESLFPFWNDPQHSYDEHPRLLRKIGVSITARMRMHRGKMDMAPHLVSPEEGFDFQNEDDVLLAEYYLKKRLGLLPDLADPTEN